jgi:putative ABC transport system permease protein
MRRVFQDAARRAIGLVRRAEVERRLDAEMRYHIEMLTDRYVRSGLSPADASRRALAEFGGTERFKDDVRDEYRGRFIDELVQNLRYAIRVIRRNPGFATAATLTIALGIGASTAIFSVVHGVLLRPLPYADPDRLVVLWEQNLGHGSDRNVVSVPTFEAWRTRTRSFDGMAGMVPLPATIAAAPNPERIMGAEVSPGYFELLGVSPALGRTFTAEEEQGGGANVLVLSDGFWRSHFGADRGVIGRTLSIDGRAHTIIGVMPRSFDPPRFAWLDEQALWRPFGPTESNRRWGRFLLIIARVKRDLPAAAALADVRAIASQHAVEDKANEGWSATLVPLAEQITGDVRLPLLALLGAVGLLLLMSVTNVANLTLGLVRRREHELALRRAIGATSARLVRQLLTQSVVVGSIGCVAGLGVAFIGARALQVLLPPDTPRLTSVRIDVPVLAFALAVAMAASLAVGVVAALRAGRDGATSLRERGGGRAAARLRGGSLVTAEVALGLVLTVAGGLAMRTFVALRSVQLGFDAEHVVVARVAASGARYAEPGARVAFFDGLLTRVRSLPGVQAASLISTRPLGGMAPATTLGDAGASATADSVVADVRYADGALFQTLRTPVIVGSTFDSRDALDAPPRVIVNQTLARRIWGSANPIGKRLRVPMFNGIVPEVIGVVGDVHLMSARTPPRGTIYLANTRFPMDAADLIVRAAADAGALAASARAAVAALDATVPLYEITTLDGAVGRALARDRFTAALLGAFAVVSLLLAAIGIYGVFAGDVAQRRKEIGIRVALGAPSSGVVGLVMRRAVVRALIGIALGTVGAVLAARAMRSLLYGVSATDPMSFLGVAGLLLAVAVAATLVPALRAARVSPLVAIRVD